MSQAEFVDAVGWVFEHSSWVAERAWHKRPFDSLAGAMFAEVLTATEVEQLTLLRAHPDLGTRARISESSTAEQQAAGLDQLTPEEYAHLHQLNAAYKEKFGFPFLYAVKGSNKSVILKSLETRLHSDRPTEFAEALQQVRRIAENRLREILQ